MNNQNQEQLIALVLKKLAETTKQEQEIFHRILKRERVTRNINDEFETQLTFGQRVADKVASFGGSWSFIFLFGSFLVIWVVINSILLANSKNAFDPYPYILLNLLLSMTAAIQAPVIMMSQNRQAAKDRMDANHDYEVNLKAEMEIAALHEKLDMLREKQWADLVSLQQEQISLLQKILENKS